jgi:phosphate transport system permease protein
VSSPALRDRLGFYACWAAGITLCVVAGSIVLFMLFKGITELRPGMLFERANVEADQTRRGGLLDPIMGSLIVTVIGILIALPVGIAIALWLTEYGARHGWRAPSSPASRSSPARRRSSWRSSASSSSRARSSSVLSFKPEGADTSFGRSFAIAGSMMALIALPLIVGATREGLNAIPGHVREASYALGKTKAATIRASCCRPSARTSRRDRARAWAASSATPRSS